MSCEQGEMGSRRRLARSPATVAPLDDDDLLSEILLRLTPLPSSLPHASAICKRWRSLASDPAFSRRFRRHHRRNPLLLGFLHESGHGLSFVPTLEAPNRVPPGRFSLDNHLWLLGCSHGLVLIFDQKQCQFLVCHPITGQQNRLAHPPVFDRANVHGAVFRSAAGDVQHFKVVLVRAESTYTPNRRMVACVYSSETRVWGNLISTPIPSGSGTRIFMEPAVLVGDSLYWIVLGSLSNIIEFDLETESLSLTRMPIWDIHGVLCFTIMTTEGGGLGFLSVSGFTAQLWRRKTDSDGVASWEMETTIELDRLLSLNSDSDVYPMIHGFAEDHNLLLLRTDVSLFTLQLESLQLKRLPKPQKWHHYHAFQSVYAAGNSMPLHRWYTRTKFCFNSRPLLLR